MKKVFAIAIVLCGLCIFSGCEDKKESENEKVMKDYAVSYYNAHLKGTEGLKIATISISQLKDAIAKIGDNYDMSKLSSCKDDSYVELIINQTNNDVDSVTYHLQCN